MDIYGHIGGAIVGGILAFALNVKKWQGFIENQFCKILAIIATIVLCVMGVGEAHIGKDQSSLMDKRVMYIREQPVADYEMKSYGTKTYGEALDDYEYKMGILYRRKWRTGRTIQWKRVL